MRPTKRQKVLNNASSRPNEEQWCLNRVDCLSFKEFIEFFDCLDRERAQHRFEYILNKHFSTKSDQNTKIKADYESWKSSADYLRYWESRLDKLILQKMSLASSELINTTISKKIESLQAAATSSSGTASESHDTDNNAIASDLSATTTTASHTTAYNNIASQPAPTTAVASHSTAPATSNEHDTHLELENKFVTISRATIDDDTTREPWIVANKDVGTFFKRYQQAIYDMVDQHTALPLESYIHELAALTHILIVCKNQHSTIAEKIFTLDLLKKLGDTFASDLIRNVQFGQKDYMTINTYITKISQTTNPDRERVIVALTNTYPNLSYGKKRVIMGINNLIQKLPITPLNDLTTLSESELWSTYFDPMLSVLISDPDKLIHLRWTNAIPIENGKSRPDAVICEKPQMDFKCSVGFGEAKVYQGSGRHSLCMDTLRLAIFSKNAIDVHKLDAALAFQIHGFNITFYITQLTVKGIYTFVEIGHMRFPQSLEDLPSFFTLATLNRLLSIHDSFWRYCKKSAHPDIIKSRYKPTLLTLDTIIDPSHDSTRLCQQRYGH